jgi:hypothetical protein
MTASTAALSYTYAYGEQSLLVDDARCKQLFLATCAPNRAAALFRGRLLSPKRTMDGLLSVADVGPAALRLPSLGSLAKNPAEGLLAVDAVTSAIGGGRLGEPNIAAIAQNIVNWNAHTKTKRAVPRLVQIAKASASHTRCVAQALKTAPAPVEYAMLPASRPLRELLAALRRRAAGRDRLDRGPAVGKQLGGHGGFSVLATDAGTLRSAVCSSR